MLEVGSKVEEMVEGIEVEQRKKLHVILCSHIEKFKIQVVILYKWEQFPKKYKKELSKIAKKNR